MKKENKITTVGRKDADIQYDLEQPLQDLELPRELCVLRPSQIYGNENVVKKNQPLIYAMIEAAKHNRNITIYGRNDALRNYIYIGDVVKTIKGVIESDIVGTYNVIYPKNIRLSEVAKIINDTWRSKGQVLFQTDKETIEDNPFFDDCDLYEKLGINQLVDFGEGMKKIYDAEK